MPSHALHVNGRHGFLPSILTLPPLRFVFCRAVVDMAVLFSRSCIAPRIRACPRQPLFAYTYKRELFAFRQREPQFAPLLQLPPASKAPGIYNNTAGILISQHCCKRKKLRPCTVFKRHVYRVARLRARPRQPLAAFTIRREKLAARQREPQYAPLLQLPPASKALQA